MAAVPRLLLTSMLAGAVMAGCGGDVVRPPPDAGSDASITNDTSPVDAAPADAPRTCTSSADCGPGLECLIQEGCATPNYCGPALGRPCTGDLVDYCGCDGVTFQASSTCPTRSYRRRGPCAGPDAGPFVCRFPDGRVCPLGASCPAPDGCNTCTCQRDGSLPCTERACIDAGPPVDVAVPRRCRSTSDCPPSMICEGPQGCDAIWTCTPVRDCTPDIASFCGCDGRTFTSSSTCIGQPYQYRGACRTDGGLVDAPTACRANDARGEGACDLFLGYAWNGRTCQGLSGCRCVGTDCRALFSSIDECRRTYATCPAS